MCALESRALGLLNIPKLCLTPSELGGRCIWKWEHRFWGSNSGFTKDLHWKLQCKSLVNPLPDPKNWCPHLQMRLSPSSDGVRQSFGLYFKAQEVYFPTQSFPWLLKQVVRIPQRQTVAKPLQKPNGAFFSQLASYKVNRTFMPTLLEICRGHGGVRAPGFNGRQAFDSRGGGTLFF